MPIDFKCTQCQHTLRVPETTAGKKARCPQCGHVQEIPAEQPQAPAQDFDLNQFDAPSPAGSGSPPPDNPYLQDPYSRAPSSSGNYGQPQHSQVPTSHHAPNPYQAPAMGMQQPVRKTRAEVRNRVLPPAIAMLAIAALTIAGVLLMLMGGVVSVMEDGADEGDVTLFVILAILLVLELVVVAGAARMMFLKNYGLAMTAAVLSLACGLCCQLALPFGIWAIIILVDADVKAAFREDPRIGSF